MDVGSQQFLNCARHTKLLLIKTGSWLGGLTNLSKKLNHDLLFTCFGMASLTGMFFTSNKKLRVVI